MILGGAFLITRAVDRFPLGDPRSTAESIRSLRAHPYVAPGFVAAYVVATALALPGSALTIAGGAIFGFEQGVALNWLGATLGATLAFLLARGLGLDAVRRILGSRADRLERLTGTHGFVTVLRLRLIPLVPFNLLNFAAGLAGIRLRDYVFGTMLGLIPGTIVYTYFADALLAGITEARRTALLRLLLAGAALVALSFVPTLAARFRRAD